MRFALVLLGALALVAAKPIPSRDVQEVGADATDGNVEERGTIPICNLVNGRRICTYKTIDPAINWGAPHGY